MQSEAIKQRINSSQSALMSEVGSRIKSMRQTKGWTQQQLADRLGLSRAAVTQWESGQATCNYAQALELERILEQDVSYILFGRFTRKSPPQEKSVIEAA